MSLHDYSFDEELRSYQVEYKEKIFKAWETKRTVMLQMPTGTGKTRLFVSIVKDLRQSAQHGLPKILILAHRRELIDQIYGEISGKYQIPSGTIMSGNLESKAVQVQIASVPTMKNDKRLNRWKEFGFNYIIIDEAHHVKADSYRRIIKTFPNAKILGVTATPYRMNGQGFSYDFEELIETRPVIDYINQGYLCDYDYFSLSPDTKTNQQILSITKFDVNGDYSNSEMIRIMDKKVVLAGIVDMYKKHAYGKRGIVFTINRDHNEHTRNQFTKEHIRAEAIDCNTNKEDRERIVQQFRDGQIDVLCNVDIFGEGFDCPDVEFIQLARPTRSLALYLQQVGRGLRASPGKEKVIFLDNVGSFNRFGSPSKYRNWQQYFKGFDKNYPPDESPKNGVDDHQVSYFQTFEEGEEEISLVETTISDDNFDKLLECIICDYKDSPSHKEAYREYLYKRYRHGTVINYIAIIPNHIDHYLQRNYNQDFASLYYIIDPQILIKIQNKIFSDSKFKDLYSRNLDRYQHAFERYIDFAKDYFIVINRAPEENNAIEEAKRDKELRDNQKSMANAIRYDLESLFFSNGLPLPNDILEKMNELKQSLDKYK
jgi:superfamily II DNA or RNA helicase